ncbi:MAG: lysophospholipid acyltransferase family protein [Bacteroidaceae bacterium]|nr:lysophospholipid acyltransferase family protein [Bacteroidaceae bacterium]
MHKWLIRMLRHIDVRILYLFVAIFVIPVCLVLNPSRGIAYRYFRRRIGYGRLKSAWKTYVNHCLFGQVVVDKFAMYAGKKFDVEVENYNEFLERASREEEGFVQLSAHIGSYEIAGYTLAVEGKSFNALVFAGEKASVMQNRDKMFAGTNIKMIAIQQDMSHLFEIDKALTDGGIVSMPADRINGSQKCIEHVFLGAKAKFPLGPFSVATMRGLDVLAVNVMKDSLLGYKIYVTPLAYDKEASRQEQIRQLSSAYVAELEKRVRQYPTQWYNYFEFWQEG